MEAIFNNCAGIDVHKKFLVVCWRHIDAEGRVHTEKRRFRTMIADLEALAAWLAERGCTHVAIESTGVYWQPVYNILEEHFEVWLVNAQHVRNVPGRKTDMTDAEWLAQLMQYGLLKPSFIPPRPQRELRELVRYRQSLVEERTRVVNRLQKVLEDANIKLSSVVSDIQGVSAQAMLQALVQGVTDAQALAELAQGRLRNKLEELEQALTGRVRPHHRFLLAELLAHLAFVDERIAHLEAEIERRLAEMPEFVAAIERLETIPGVDRLTAITIVAEIGVDMSRFSSDRHLTSWAGMAPGNNQSGGKQRAGKTRKGNRYLRRVLVQAAHAAARAKGTYLKARYHRLAARRGKKRAAVAVGCTILRIAYFLILREETYRELGEDHFDRLDKERTTQRLVRRLENLGYTVELHEINLQETTGLPTVEVASP